MHFSFSYLLPSPPKALPYHLQPRKNATQGPYALQPPLTTTTQIHLVPQGVSVHIWGEARPHLHALLIPLTVTLSPAATGGATQAQLSL